MEALKLFSQHAPNRTFIAVVFGGLAGLFYAFLIPVVMAAVTNGADNFITENAIIEVFGIKVANSELATFFIALCLMILLCKSCSEVLLSRISLDIRFQLRKKIYSKINKAPIQTLEHVGVSRLILSLSTDVSSIVMGAQLFPQLLSNGVVIIGMLGYLAYLDMSAFAYIGKVIVIGVVTYQLPVFLGIGFFRRTREHQDQLQEAFKGLVEGAKELRLSPEKRETYERQVLYKQEGIIRTLEKRGMTIFSLANNYGNLISFFTIGGLSFIFVNYNSMSVESMMAAIMVLLYVTSPIAILLSFIPQLARTKISLRKVNKLFDDLNEEKIAPQQESLMLWNTISLKDIEYTHLSDGDESQFKIGPISLDIVKGEITFIAGGNGSGKSTLAKVISQHYLPTAGYFMCDSQIVSDKNFISLRSNIACIFSDYYLFNRLLNLESLSNEVMNKAQHFLKVFALDQKVKIKNGRFSTLKLSDGQRRRLALLVAILDDRDLYVFDEWAADQDPEFKDIFYREILPLLKSQNKGIVVVSHDDRYFDAADVLYQMETGKIVRHIERNFENKASA